MAEDHSVHSYVIAIGSNQSRSIRLTPHRLVKATIDMLNCSPLKLMARSRIIDCAPLGPSRRRYANAAVLVETALSPPALLELLQQAERYFGRRRGQRWGARPLDLDIIFWSGGMWANESLVIPHPAFRERTFVLAPLTQFARNWRDPVTGLTPGQLLARLKKPRGHSKAG